MTTRRQFLALSGAFALAPVAADAQTGRTQVAGVYRRSVGDITVTALLDGFIGLDPAMLTGVDAAKIPDMLARAFLAPGAVDTSINAYLIESGGQTVLVDGGAAGAFGPTANGLVAAMDAAGLDPNAVDTVFSTHLHPDHIGALTDGAAARFPNAELAVHGDERAFWTDDANFAGADEQTQGFAAAARAALGAYADRTKLIADGADIAPGVRAMHLPGHTSGHTGLMLSSGDATMLLWADIIHIGPLQFANPELTIPFDVDQPKAAETRAKIFDMVAADRLEIAGSHIDFPSFGHLAKRRRGYRFAKARWDHQL